MADAGCNEGQLSLSVLHFLLGQCRTVCLEPGQAHVRIGHSHRERSIYLAPECLLQNAVGMAHVVSTRHNSPHITAAEGHLAEEGSHYPGHAPGIHGEYDDYHRCRKYSGGKSELCI